MNYGDSHLNNEIASMIDPQAPSFIALQKLLDLEADCLSKALIQARADDGYTRYEFPKGNGQVRVINAPAEELKLCQRKLLDDILSQISVTPFAHGFVPHRSIITNALIHAPSARSIFNLDLKDAFPSVSEQSVYRIIQWRVGEFLKVNTPQLSSAERNEIYQMITRLCTRDGALPQGAPTSGYLLNLACARLDRLVYAAALKSGLPQIKYTRYADDLTISSSAPIPPEFIAQVKRAVVRSGFQVHPHKVHCYNDHQKAIVICGIRIHNRGLALPKASLKRYRAQLNDFAHKNHTEITEQEKAKILGVISFLRSIYPAPPSMIVKPLNAFLQQHSSWVNAPKLKSASSFKHFSYNPEV